jgi:hypothetical protein
LNIEDCMGHLSERLMISGFAPGRPNAAAAGCERKVQPIFRGAPRCPKSHIEPAVTAGWLKMLKF